MNRRGLLCALVVTPLAALWSRRVSARYVDRSLSSGLWAKWDRTTRTITAHVPENYPGTFTHDPDEPYILGGGSHREWRIALDAEAIGRLLWIASGLSVSEAGKAQRRWQRFLARNSRTED